MSGLELDILRSSMDDSSGLCDWMRSNRCAGRPDHCHYFTVVDRHAGFRFPHLLCHGIIRAHTAFFGSLEFRPTYPCRSRRAWRLLGIERDVGILVRHRLPGAEWFKLGGATRRLVK
ncbi:MULTISPECIES: hypothetical protein [Burkholderia]|uniref:hypothetical protein n=1 Tax=Burkholderia TaxID=32008 RepID=UPI00158326D7|nr:MULTISPECIES: hypothetical protein [Burkholderia]